MAATENAEAKKVKAKQEKESNISQYQAETRKKKAEADKQAKLSENSAGIEVAKSEANLGKEQSAAQRVIGESKANADMAVGIAEAKKEEEIAKAKRKAEEEKLKSTVMVETEIEADRKRAEAAGTKDKIITEAQAEAEAIKLKAAAEAEAIRIKKLADAEGELKFAEVKRKNIEAESAHIVAMANAKAPEQAIISWILRDQYKEIAEADAKKFEHISTGNVTVIGGSQEAGNFLLNTVKAVSQVSGVKDLLPGVSGLIGKAKKFDEENNEKENFEDVK